MIKINLAPRTYAKSSGSLSGPSVLSPDQIRSEVLKRLGVILFPVFIMYGIEFYRIPELNQELQKKQRELSEVQKHNQQRAASVEEIKKFKDDEKKIQAKIEALETISKKRLSEIRLLDLVQNAVPYRLWLTQLDLTGNKLKIQGMGLSETEISTFLDNLTKSAFLTDVVLESTTEIVQDSMPIKKFFITANLEFGK